MSNNPASQYGSAEGLLSTLAPERAKPQAPAKTSGIPKWSRHSATTLRPKLSGKFTARSEIRDLGMQDDTHRALEEIQQGSRQSLVTHMLEIQRHRTSHDKSEVWATHLRFLQVPDNDLNCPRSRTRTLMRTHWSEKPYVKEYVAVSYTWKASEHEESRAGGYTIRSGPNEHPSKIRDIVLYRAVRYALAHGAELLWIDQECIDQKDQQDKAIGVQSMDIVYSLSSLPLGLLSVTINSQEDLDLLQILLRREFVQNPDGPQFPKFKLSVDKDLVSKVEKILSWVTSDLWWTRAWTYQEEYRTSGRMCLLIPHASSLRKEKMFGTISGELQVTSKQFRTAVSEFLLACENAGYGYDKSILRKAKQYNIVNRSYSDIRRGNVSFKGMSSTVFSDIADRDLTDCADILAITGNCCGYSVRLDAKTLVDAGVQSLSTCILALYFLNGELPKNEHDYRNISDDASQKRLSYDVYNYLANVSLDDIEPPVSEKQLTFIKRCRLQDVTLTEHGIKTTGWLWELGEEIHTGYGDFKERFWYKPDNIGGATSLEGICRGRLRQMAAYLRSQKHYALADDLFLYLKPDSILYPSTLYKDLMAGAVGEEIHRGGVVRLGRLVGQSQYRALFLSQYPPHYRGRIFVFTSWSGRDEALDKYVSIEVRVNGKYNGLARLRTKRWLNGLWFADGTNQEKVVFPWPF